MTNTEMEIFIKALKISRKYFEGKFDKGGSPYESHLLSVADKVRGKAKVVAILHDILEDTDCTRENLFMRGIPEDLICSIETLTRGENETYSSYISNIVESGDVIALLVKRADLEHNMNLSRLKRITQDDIDRVSKRYLPAYMKVSNKIKDLGIEY